MKIVYTSLGAPYFAEYLAKNTGGIFKAHDECIDYGRANRDAYLFLVGMYYPISSVYKKISKFKKVIILFAGSDILKLKTFSKDRRNKMIRDASNRGAMYATESPLMREKIKKDFKIDTEIIYLPASCVFPEDPYPLPKKFSIGCYMPCNMSKGKSKRFFYGFSKILEAVKALPEVDFHFYSRSGYVDIEGETSLPNFIPYEDNVTNMPEFLKNISCGLRITDHDTYSMSAIEYNMAGRWFINNHEMPYCDKLDHDPSVEDVVDLIREVKKRQGCNAEGKKLYDKNHSVDFFKETIKKHFRSK